MGGAEGVGSHPLHQSVIFYDNRRYIATPRYREIFVTAKALQINGLAVEQQSVALYFDLADANGQRITIIDRAPPR